MFTIGVTRFSKSMIPFDFKVKIQPDLTFLSAMTAMLLLDFYALTIVIYTFCEVRLKKLGYPCWHISFALLNNADFRV